MTRNGSILYNSLVQFILFQTCKHRTQRNKTWTELHWDGPPIGNCIYGLVYMIWLIFKKMMAPCLSELTNKPLHKH